MVVLTVHDQRFELLGRLCGWRRAEQKRRKRHDTTVPDSIFHHN